MQLAAKVRRVRRLIPEAGALTLVALIATTIGQAGVPVE